MALTKQAKAEAIDKVKSLLASSKMTVAARYSGTSVKELQGLRRQAKDNGTTIIVVKNRLFKRALESSGFKQAAGDIALTGQLIYAFNDSDEAAAAQVLANFAKTNPQVELITGLDATGAVMAADDLTMLASLPTKQQLRSMLAGTLMASFGNLVGVLSAPNRSLLNVLAAHADIN